MSRVVPLASTLLLVALGMPPASAAARAEETSPHRAPPAPLYTLEQGQVDLQPISGGFASPLGVTNAGDGSDRLFVVERDGTVRVVIDAVVQPGAFLDVSSLTDGGGERGLLGLAFHPNFEANRKLYVDYTRQSDGAIVISEFVATSDGLAVDEATGRVLLVIPHPGQSNHNGGQLTFGPDGYLYISTGDGGGSGDPGENAQDTSSLLGKILRIDVDTTMGGLEYGIPSNNPFAASAGADEIWSYGLRNPWRFSFDPATNAMWIADVGQSDWEEINREPSATGGRNYGWDCREGLHPFENAGCDTDPPWPYVDPIAEYNHSLGCSVTGGHVYRGSTQPDLVGHYVLADFCSGRLWTIPFDGATLVFHRTKTVNISSFGISEQGELYATDLGGDLYRVVAPAFDDILSSPFLDDINWIAEAGITQGCTATMYCPQNPVTREQMAAFLDRALNLPDTGTDYFTDDEGSFAEQSINNIRAANITTGCTATTFCPTQNVTREQMAAFLDRALNLPDTGTDFFTDDEGSWAEQNINNIAAAEITTGCTPTTYCPTQNITRGQMAAFLRRALA